MSEEGRITDCLNDEAAVMFASFCDLLCAYYHIKFHTFLEEIKKNYRVFNPNGEIQPLFSETLPPREEMAQAIVNQFTEVLEQANYYPLSSEVIRKSTQKRSLIQLKTEVDFDNFQDFICYYRGDVQTTITVKKFFFWQQEKTVDMLERLVLLMRFEDEAHWRNRSQQQKAGVLSQALEPDKMYVYFYKNIPKSDLDLLFPNTETRMLLRDRLILIGSAIGAAGALLSKTLPNLLLLLGAILITFNARSALQPINVEEEQARQIMPVLVSTLSLAIALGGFAARQYSQYKSKRIKFQKQVTDTLFFKNLANNASVFQMLIDLAEEEECKEMILVYYHLLTSSEPLTAEALDAQIEAWLLAKTGQKINFDIQGPLNNLQRIHGEVRDEARSLLNYDEQSCCQVLPLESARQVLDYVWDNLFCYNKQR